MTVPAHTAIRRSKVGNIDTDRLKRRRLFVALSIKQYGRFFETRVEFAFRCAELAVIERELVSRGELAPAHRVIA